MEGVQLVLPRMWGALSQQELEVLAEPNLGLFWGHPAALHPQGDVCYCPHLGMGLRALCSSPSHWLQEEAAAPRPSSVPCPGCRREGTAEPKGSVLHLAALCVCTARYFAVQGYL